jgi:hypothetical protein
VRPAILALIVARGCYALRVYGAPLFAVADLDAWAYSFGDDDLWLAADAPKALGCGRCLTMH